MSARIERVFEATLCGIDVPRGCRRVEHSQKRESEVVGSSVRSSTFPPCHWSRTQSLANTLGAIGLADVLTSVAGVRGEVDAHHRSQGCAPRGVAVLTHHRLQLRMTQDEVVEAWKRHWFDVLGADARVN